MRHAPTFRDRLFEWTMAAVLLGLGVWLVIWPASMRHSAFRLMLDFIGPQFLTALYLVVGAGRLAALWINGRSHVIGPHVRAAGCVVGAMIFFQMDLALLGLIELQQTDPSPGIVMYSALAAAEIYSTYWAVRDAKSRS